MPGSPGHTEYAGQVGTQLGQRAAAKGGGPTSKPASPLLCWAGLGVAQGGGGRRGAAGARLLPLGAHLSHALRAPELVDELIQGVDRQLPAQQPHLGQQVLLQPLNAFQDAGAVQVPLRGAKGACRAGRSGETVRATCHSPTRGGPQPRALQDRKVWGC